MNFKWDINGLIPCIVQDIESKEVLMLAYCNSDALHLTIQTKQMHYFSRSKNRIWKKGESSGNTQHVVELRLDCDNDSLLALVKQQGAACHTGNKSCFYKDSVLENVVSDNSDIQNSYLDSKELDKEMQSSILESSKFSIYKYGIIDTLYHILLDRKGYDPTKSYTASLCSKGENAILKKVVEECAEFCLAFKDGHEDDIVYECSDMVYHTLVALSFQEINPDKVKQELIRRFGVSGIDEKNARLKSQAKD